MADEVAAINIHTEPMAIGDEVGGEFFFNFSRCTQIEVAHAASVCERTVNDWYNFCREVILHHIEHSSTPIGGPGKIVEIDEAKFGKRKYNRGRYIEGVWVFGGFERDSKKTFMVPVPDRSRETLVAQIRKWILPGTKIISDCWAAYSQLQLEGYTHETVNHSKNFVDPETGASTQNIERCWRDARADVPKYGRREDSFVKYLANHLFRRKYPKYEARFHVFMRAVANLYPPPVSPAEHEFDDSQ
ncbi:uncharacterized protein LOC135216219 [Macrobrachium nipponense]|uniref:uncharacterized protein LOC135216219 n=1 Tax=Macrobrachium nipponense TaxID=159736 RepID=UPI0030C83A02